MSYRPMFKSVYPFFKVGEQTIHMGSIKKPIEIEDENGSIYKLLTLMDGSRTLEQIIEAIQTDYPTITAEEIQQAIRDLDELGFVIDASKVQQSSLTEKEKERFRGNLQFFNYYANSNLSPWELQERLCKAKVTVIGMGGFGSNLLIQLAGLGIKHVTVVDFDRVELSNLNRQILFNEKDLGRPKVEVAKEFMSSFYSDMQIEAVQLQINSSKMVEDVIQGSDLVLLAADRPPYFIRYWVNQACVKQGIPYIAGGLQVISCEFFSVIPHVTGCFDCMQIRILEINETYLTQIQSAIDFQPPNFGCAPNMMITTGMIISEAVKILTGVTHPKSAGKLCVMDLETYESEILVEWERRKEECPTCGKGKMANHPLFQWFKETEKTFQS